MLPDPRARAHAPNAPAEPPESAEGSDVPFTRDGDTPGLARCTREDDGYWHRRPTDHNGVGLYKFGPQPGRPMHLDMVPDAIEEAVEPPSPSVARARMRLAKKRARQALMRRPSPTQRLVAAILGR